MMNNSIVYLFGFSGTGKYTVAKSFAERTQFILVHNHLINNPVFALVRKNGSTPIPWGAWREIRKIRDAVMNTVAYIADSKDSFIFTNELLNRKEDYKIFTEIEDIATIRKATFLPIRLLCSEEEHLRRVALPDRDVMMKETNVENIKERRGLYEVFKPEHENLFELDITNVTPADAAQMIEKRLKEIHS